MATMILRLHVLPEEGGGGGGGAVQEHQDVICTKKLKVGRNSVV